MNRITQSGMNIKLFCVIVVLGSVTSRKYDVDSEAMKLFGEDLPSVVARFRKSPEYMKILQDKLTDLREQINDMGLQTLYYYHGKLETRVGEIVGVNKDTTPPQNSYYKVRRVMGRKQNDNSVIPPVKSLDKYFMFSTALSIPERNSFKDLGFEYTGHVIHSIIKSMGVDESRSTRHPPGDDDKKSTTEHAHNHEVTSSTLPPETTTAGDTTSSDSLAYRFKSNLH